MKLRQKQERPPDDGRGRPFCRYCGTARVWSAEWTSGFSSDTGEPIVYHQWVCPKWPDEPGKHDCSGYVEVRK